MNDALERLRKRNRPTVPDRDASLIPPASASVDTSISRYQDTKKSVNQGSELSKGQSLEKPLATKQSTLRLEQGISDRLQEVCRDNGVCREVLIEAMFEYVESHPEALRSVLSNAKNKNEQRQQIANLKRAKSMMQRFGQLE